MKPIPLKHRKQIDADPYFKKCALCGRIGVQVHHVFQGAHGQIAEMWNYQPLCVEHHEQATPHNFKYMHEVRERAELKCLQRANPVWLQANHPRRNWLQMYKYLKSKYET